MTARALHVIAGPWTMHSVESVPVVSGTGSGNTLKGGHQFEEQILMVSGQLPYDDCHAGTFLRAV